MYNDLHPVVERLVEEAYRLAAALPMLLLALLVVWIAWRLGGWLSRRSSLGFIGGSNPLTRGLARTTTRWVVALLGVLLALEIMNATALVGAVLGTAGVLGVALGFAFKDILENYLAGILMSTRQMFAPRDHVVIDGNEGIVVAMTSRATILITLDGNHLRLPNAMVFRGVTLNYTRNPNRRFSFEVGIGVHEDLVQAQRLGIEELLRVDGVLAEPPPRASINALGDSSVQVRYVGWVDQREHDFILVRSEAIRRVKLALEAADMDMPEPIYRVQLSEPAPARPARPKARSVQPATPSAAAEERDAREPDTRVNSDLAPQIDREQRERGEQDLLDTDAPRE